LVAVATRTQRRVLKRRGNIGAGDVNSLLKGKYNEKAAQVFVCAADKPQDFLKMV
jgi:hypothetical protein